MPTRRKQLKRVGSPGRGRVSGTRRGGRASARVGAYVRRTGDRRFVMSLARGLAVLLAFSEKWRHLSMSQVSHRTGISRAAVGRSLHTLCELGYVAVDESQRYYLRPKVMAFGHAYISGNPLPALAQPVLDRVTEKLGQACSLAIPDGDEIVYLARGMSSRIMSQQLNVGGRAPLYCSSIGLVLLADRGEAALAGYLARVKLVRHTENTLADPMALRQALQGIRRDGYAIANQHRETRLCTMAVPLRDHSGAAFGGINIIVRIGSVAVSQLSRRYLGPLVAAAAEIERLLNA